jgi:hypothetical protein
MTDSGLAKATGTDDSPRETSRRTLLRKGLLLGAGAVAVGVAAPVLTGAGTARAAVSGQGDQDGWSWCYHCQSLFYGIWQAYSFCPGPTGRHSASQSLYYYLQYGSPSGQGTQADWAWCYLCQALFYAPFQGYSVCPAPAAAGGNHSDAQSGNYDMLYGEPWPNQIFLADVGIQNGWLWCNKCMGTFYGPWQEYSLCPAQGTHNGGTSYYTYDMNYLDTPPTT